MTDPVHYALSGKDVKTLTRSLEARVREGRLAPGERVPTVRALARSLGLSPTTVSAAYKELRQRGVLATHGRNGTRVSARPPLPLPRSTGTVGPGLRDVASGNPDVRFLPRLGPALRDLRETPRLYGTPAHHPELLALARRDFSNDRIPADHLAVVGGAMDGIERILQAHLRPGDRVAVEDPGYSAVLDLLGALGLGAEPVPIDDFGMQPKALRTVLGQGASACILTPRAQNPTGAALDEARARELRQVLAGHADVLVIEDDHAGPVAGAPALTTVKSHPGPWAVVRSVSKWLGPDLRVAFLAGDETTVSRVEGRLSLGNGWVSHVLQELVVRLWKASANVTLLREANRTYHDRRHSLLQSVRRHFIKATGRSGFNVWIPVPEEAAVAFALAARGWAVRTGEPYRLASPPAIRVTAAALKIGQTQRFADDLAAVLRPRRRIVLP